MFCISRQIPTAKGPAIAFVIGRRYVSVSVTDSFTLGNADDYGICLVDILAILPFFMVSTVIVNGYRIAVCVPGGNCCISSKLIGTETIYPCSTDIPSLKGLPGGIYLGCIYPAINFLIIAHYELSLLGIIHTAEFIIGTISEIALSGIDSNNLVSLFPAGIPGHIAGQFIFY